MLYKLLLFCVLILIHCSQAIEEDILATVGRKKITVNDFITRLEFTPRALFQGLKNFDKNQKYLDMLISEKLFSIKAEEEGLAEYDSIKKMVQVIEDRAMIKELYRQVIQRNIDVTDNEVVDAYSKMNMELFLTYFKTRNKKQAATFKSQLESGAMFEEALESAYGIPVDIMDYRQRLQWGDFNHRIEEAAYKLKIGDVSPIIDTHIGYYILKLDSFSVKRNVFNDDFSKKQSGIRKLIRMRKETELSIQYVKEFMESLEIKLKKQVFDVLADELVKHVEFTNQPASNSLDFEVFSDDEIKIAKLSLQDILDEKLVIYKTGSWTVDAIWERLKLYSYPLNKESKETFIASLNRSIKYFVRDNLLVQRAQDRELDRSMNVKNEVRVWRDNFLYNTYRNFLLEKGIHVEGELKKLRKAQKIAIDLKKLEQIEITDINVMAVNPGWVTYLVVPPFPEF